MKGGGVFRGMMKGITESFGRKTEKVYPDPVIEHVDHQHSRKSTKRSRTGRRRLGVPKCHPGTITYRDQLVRHLGYDRRAADRMLKAWRDEGGDLPELHS